MTPVELALVNLGEVTARELHQAKNTIGRKALRKDVLEAGEVAGNARKEIEKRSGKKVISKENHLNLEKETFKKINN